MIDYSLLFKLSALAKERIKPIEQSQEFKIPKNPIERKFYLAGFTRHEIDQAMEKVNATSTNRQDALIDQLINQHFLKPVSLKKLRDFSTPKPTGQERIDRK